MTSLVLRADAAPELGVGHLSRCVAVAAAARARGWDVALCGTFTAGQWLLKDLPVVETIPQADVVLTDHYELPETQWSSLTVSIEDGPFGRRRADIVVDANLYRSPRPDDGSPLVLRGPKYAPLRAEIRAARGRRAAGGTPPKVVVVMGGGAAPAAVAAAVEAIKETGVPAAVTAISLTEVPGVEVMAPTPDLPALLASADVVVSAAGVTLLELCCIGVPTALVRIADNQKAGYEAAVAQGLAAGLGTDPREHVETLRALLLEEEQRKALAEKAMATVDGRGAERILDAIESALLHKRSFRAPGGPPVSTLPEGTDNSGQPVAVRPATQADSALLLLWRNDFETRARSRSTTPVAPAEHEAWLARVLNDPHRRLLIAERDGHPVGTVRFDRGDDHWEVSITVAPEVRGLRLAVPILLAAERSLRNVTIRAHVRRDNVASQALFRRAGYQERRADYRERRTDGEWTWLDKNV
jgi:spore coat polysaccharide biosynthesis predicted glycosyltransferase SpsG/ribosomal protein S18 acetylase RimI-like enzyme